MIRNWYKIGGANLSFSSRPISFYVETLDGSDYTITLSTGETGTYASGENAMIMYSGAISNPSFSFANPLNIKRFKTTDTLHIDNQNMGWLNIEILEAGSSANITSGDMSGVSNLTSLTYLYLYGNGFTGDMSGVSNLTSLTYLYLQGNGFTGDMS